MLSYAYADESGDAGYQFERGSSAHFVMCLMLPEHEEDLVDRLLVLRRRLERPAAFEFHYRQMDNSLRAAFFTAIQPASFTLLAATVDKRRAPSDFRKLGKSGLYAHALAGLALRAPQPLQDTKLYLDGGGAQSRFLQEIKTSIRYACRAAGRPTQNFHDLRLLDSSNPLIQCADMFAGTMANRLRGENPPWHHIVSARTTVAWHEDFHG